MSIEAQLGLIVRIHFATQKAFQLVNTRVLVIMNPTANSRARYRIWIQYYSEMNGTYVTPLK